MKALKLFSLAILSFFASQTINAQNKTETFAVSGNCGMCKTNIETAAKAAGASSANWDVDAKKLTVKFNAKKSSVEKIQRKIAEVGYDNAGFKTTTEAYDKLHFCCKYERATEQANAMACCEEHAKGGEHSATCKKGEGEKCEKDCCKKS